MFFDSRLCRYWIFEFLLLIVVYGMNFVDENITSFWSFICVYVCSFRFEIEIILWFVEFWEICHVRSKMRMWSERNSIMICHFYCLDFIYYISTKRINEKEYYFMFISSLTVWYAFNFTITFWNWNIIIIVTKNWNHCQESNVFCTFKNIFC